VGLLGAADLAIWQHARENGLVLVSKDEDFHRLSILFGPPPKVIWVRLGIARQRMSSACCAGVTAISRRFCNTKKPVFSLWHEVEGDKV